MSGRWSTILAVDQDPKACEVYRANFPDTDVRCADLRAIEPELEDLRCRVDVLLGGPPCQPFSHAGKRTGSADERDCVPDFLRAIDLVRPRQFLMEQVPGFLTFSGGKYAAHVLAEMEDMGYVVDHRVLDAVSFGAPQFRERVWFWGQRGDLRFERSRPWPVPTHVWPWPTEACMFGGDLEPAVVVGQALGLEGWYDAQNETEHGADEPIGTLQGGAQAKGGGAGHYAIQSHADPLRSASAPASALRSGGDGHDGCCVRLYRWSDAMLAKHPPAAPAATVQAKYSKGGAEGLLAIEPRGWDGHRILEADKPRYTVGGGTNQEMLSSEGRTWTSHHPETIPAAPAPAIRARSPRDGGRCVEGTLREGLRVRRLTPNECARLQTLPDDFVWPAGVAKTHRYRIIGNGWASIMGKVFAKAFAAADHQSGTLIDLFCGGGCGAVGWNGRAWEYARPGVAA